MNLKKFNVYKNSLIFDIASGVLLLAGLVVGLILGLNSIMSFNSSAILKTVIAVMIFMLIVFVYGWKRYEAYTGFTMVLAIAHNVMLTTALVCIFRMPVDESLMMVMLIVCALSAICSFILFANKKEYKQTIELLFSNKNGNIEISVFAPDFEVIEEQAIKDEAEELKSKLEKHSNLLILADFA